MYPSYKSNGGINIANIKFLREGEKQHHTKRLGKNDHWRQKWKKIKRKKRGVKKPQKNRFLFLDLLRYSRLALYKMPEFMNLEIVTI